MIDGRHDSLATQYRDQCQDTGSRFVGSVPSYQLVWIAVSYSRCRPLALPMSAEWPPAEATTLPLLAPPLAPCIDQERQSPLNLRCDIRVYRTVISIDR
jgi:hypothetical protein